MDARGARTAPAQASTSAPASAVAGFSSPARAAGWRGTRTYREGNAPEARRASPRARVSAGRRQEPDRGVEDALRAGVLARARNRLLAGLADDRDLVVARTRSRSPRPRRRCGRSGRAPCGRASRGRARARPGRARRRSPPPPAAPAAPARSERMSAVGSRSSASRSLGALVDLALQRRRRAGSRPRPPPSPAGRTRGTRRGPPRAGRPPSARRRTGCPRARGRSTFDASTVTSAPRRRAASATPSPCGRWSGCRRSAPGRSARGCPRRSPARGARRAMPAPARRASTASAMSDRVGQPADADVAVGQQARGRVRSPARRAHAAARGWPPSPGGGTCGCSSPGRPAPGPSKAR